MLDVPAVGEREHRGLLALEELLDHHLASGVVEDLFHHDVVDGPVGLVVGPADVNPLALGQPVGLDDDGDAVFVDVSPHGLGVGEGAEFPGGYRVLLAELAHEDLGGFESRRALCGSEDGKAALGELVHDPAGQGVLGTHDGEVDLFLPHEVDESHEVLGFDVDVLGRLRRARVSRGTVELVHLFRLCQLPDERMFPPAASDHKHAHGMLLDPMGRGCLCGVILTPGERPLKSNPASGLPQGDSPCE